ncbi:MULTISPECIES: type III restriction-modification system endonuclease [Moraxella]|uniref:Restriction endonuclease subunit R n=1 Tax=Moraxella lacunata TaxID=477 RepID=A0A1B8Q535_MORLA|nr:MULTISPECIES: type III restriction-modification system endonuclease [Moraxella]MBE9577884.1 type III restriction-modification system endonuclease [Moraxella sp. K1664]MBE9587306.1 type III restriction-modification system endonuclease [Moraxella sp. K1630]MBE9595542.1 type III restriction-modification system endonuclease [Moraxella sp. K2450]MDH9218166.1 type III restriction-modification system endonuclease [Moraxella lacunata]MDI4481923.1 type III restriction-modification system endonucleas
MKKGFHYEKNLPHQIGAVNAVLSVFDNVHKKDNDRGENPTLSFVGERYKNNIHQIQSDNQIDKSPDYSNVLDISMETGTGKTYTYTQTMYELHKRLGIYKFVIVVPTLSIKAGTEQFLKSDALKNHFRLDFNLEYGQAEIELYVVESQKTKKGKRTNPMPSEIVRFVQADNTQKIHVLLLNMGMVNSKTMKGEDNGNDGSILLKDKFDKPFEAIGSVNPILIIDEPHRFDDNNKTWQSLLNLNPQYILRYGATFNDRFKNLIYRLSAIDAFNQDLVKGVIAYITDIQGDDGTKIKLVESNNNQAIFELIENKKSTQKFTLNKGENLQKIHHHIDELYLQDLKSGRVILSNGIELKTGDKINPFSYANTVFHAMIRQAVKVYFETEKALLNRVDKIKPLTLFFIDDIKGYRDGDDIVGSLKSDFEMIVKDEAKKALEKAMIGTDFYRSLQMVLADVSATHGGYFSKDNSSDDEKIAKEIGEILHDKESLLSLDNPCRFIFSKWTLREGWDNPNVFGICKLRSSGSETSKLQEVGRGLRLPVNEFMSRVKDTDFKLNYFVDSSERDFVAQLKADINKAAEHEIIPVVFDDNLFEKIKSAYSDVKRRILINELYELGLIDDDDNLLAGAYETIKQKFPNAFNYNALKQGKIANSDDKQKTKVAMRTGKYDELKSLWEAINQKAILQYQISEQEILALLVDFLGQNKAKFTMTGISTKTQEMIKTTDKLIDFKTNESIENTPFEPIVTLNYRQFLQKLSQKSYIKMTTLHQAFFELKNDIGIDKFMNDETVRMIDKGFNDYLLKHSLNKFEIGYQKISNQIHPTKLTDKNGLPLPEIDINQDWGVLGDNKPFESFLFERVFFDSDIERQNMTAEDVQEVVVFTKIPKNAIKIPVAGGETYSPDFAYIVKTAKGDVLNLVLESKGVKDKDELRQRENHKIRHAERWFNAMNEQGAINVRFVTQFESDRVVDIIKQNLSGFTEK